MKELVSILIPAFNAEKWIHDCIESALAQTWPRKEIIVVDDGSRDSTLEIAKRYASANVLVTTQDNRGASAARNHALSLAQGDYIQWLDADDLLAPDKIARKMNVAEPGMTSRVLLSGAWGRFYHHPERSTFTPNSLWQDLAPLEWLLRQAEENLWMAIDSWLVSRKLTEMAGPWNESLSLNDDGDYFCRVVSCAEHIRFIPESKCYVRRGNPGLSSTNILSNRKLDSQSSSILSHIQTLRVMEDSQRMRSACLKLLQRWSIYFYPERPDIIDKMSMLAAELGGRLEMPDLKLKYRLIQKAFGWRIAKKARFFLPSIRSALEREWDLFVCLLDNWNIQKK
ncbi:MAG: putative glycosyltransferase EpsJ [Syntrophus sp. PtaB.Bin138]|nr:MAG: putative glycosyltransferase EpsJ [Syntrophus sp. PtaB.Bin138]